MTVRKAIAVAQVIPQYCYIHEDDILARLFIQ